MSAQSRLFSVLFGMSSLSAGHVAQASAPGDGRVLVLNSLSQAQDASLTKPQAQESQVQIEPFTFNTFDGKAHPAELGKLTVPEDRKSNSGRTIQVAFIRLMHRGEKAGAPVVFLPPGPGIGGSILGRVPSYFKLLDRLRDQGDVILIDIRGEGMSTPNLDECPSPDTVSPHVFESLQSYLQQWVASVSNCAQFWRSRGVKLASYNNREAADDIEALRLALHYEHLRLLGWSAGTDLGISFLRRHGDLVERAVFAATGSEELRPGRPLVDDLELDKIAVWYKAARGADAPDLGELFDQDVKALGAGNVILELAEGKDGPKVQVKIGSVLLKSLVMEMLNGTEGALLPALLTSIHDREGGLIYQYIYNAGARNTKFIPVLIRNEDQAFIPTPLQGATHYVVSTKDGYDRLYARLVNRPPAEKPKLGPLLSLPKKDVKTNFSVFLSTPIDPELWDEAKWRGVFVRIYEGRPPDLGLAFLNDTAARRIFEQWHQRYGDRDVFEELRISIIEGEVRGEQPGYSVHVGIDLENTIKLYREAGLSVNADRDGFLTLTRIHRMNPSAGSRNLELFKQAYRHFKAYTLIPGLLKPDQPDVLPIHDLGIYKSAIQFRRVEDIGPNDEDSVILHSESVERPLTDYGKKRRGKKKK